MGHNEDFVKIIADEVDADVDESDDFEDDDDDNFVDEDEDDY